MPVEPIIVDFSEVKERSAVTPARRPTGLYYAKVESVEQNNSKQGNAQLTFVLRCTDDPTASYGYHCQLDKKLAWKLHELLGACGYDVGKKKVRVDANKAVGKTIIIKLVDDEYNGRAKSEVSAVLNPAKIDAADVRNGRKNGGGGGGGGGGSDDVIEDEDGGGVDEAEYEALDVDEM